MKLRNTKIYSHLPYSRSRNQNAFTILEVMVALAIVGISIGIFFSLIGNSSRLRDKIDRHTKLLLLSRTKTEEAFLGILGKKFMTLNEEKTFEGTSKDGIPWKISEIDKYKKAYEKIKLSEVDNEESDIELPPKGTTLLSVSVEGINIETIFFPKRNEDDETEENETISD